MQGTTGARTATFFPPREIKGEQRFGDVPLGGIVVDETGRAGLKVADGSMLCRRAGVTHWLGRPPERLLAFGDERRYLVSMKEGTKVTVVGESKGMRLSSSAPTKHDDLHRFLVRGEKHAAFALRIFNRPDQCMSAPFPEADAGRLQPRMFVQVNKGADAAGPFRSRARCASQGDNWTARTARFSCGPRRYPSANRPSRADRQK